MVPDSKDILILGLGNSLLADDGVGVHIIRRLITDSATPPWVRAVDGGTAGFRLTKIIGDAAALLIIDAADLAAPPGTIRLIDSVALATRMARERASSAHEAGLANLLGLLTLENAVPRQMAVLAIQPKIIDWGVHLSRPVARAVRPACKLAQSTVCAWRSL